MASYEFYCTICMETVHVRDLFPISGCTHLFCVSCVSQYITAKLEDNMSIGCPDPGCKYGALDPEACRDMIPPQLFERWGAALCDLAVGRFKFYCPFNDCSALLVHELGHEFKRLKKDERGKNDLLLRKVARESRWQRCPKCKMYVERAEGCVYIVCRCQHRFCYLCASPMSRGIHRCSKCKRTW
nr:unnamed protein product [Digitaria exilis]